MSKTHRGPMAAHPRPAQQQPASGLFFLCSFLLLIGIPSSSYVELWAKACLYGDSSGTDLFENGSMSVQRYKRNAPYAIAPIPRVHKEQEGKMIMP